MSGIKALKELRELCVGVKSEGFSSVGCDAVLEIADEIEREHNQRVVELNGAVCERDGRIGSYERRNTELNNALKAICKRFGVSTEWSAEDAAKKVLETLERDYMELPVDADGVPICVGEDVVRTNDRLQPETVCIIGIGGRSVFFKHEGRIKQNVAHNLHHVKPRTLEDVLREFTDEVIEWSGYSGPVSGDRTWSGMAAKYVDEIRELLGGDAK